MRDSRARMLDNFPAEVPVARTETKAAELVGFAPEAPPISRQPSTTTTWDWRRSTWPTAVLWTAWVCAALTLGAVAARSGSAAEPPQLSVFKHIPVFMPTTPVLISTRDSTSAVAKQPAPLLREPARTRVVLTATKTATADAAPGATPSAPRVVTRRAAVPQTPRQPIRVATPVTQDPLPEPAPPLRDAATVLLKANPTVSPKPTTQAINQPIANAAPPMPVATSGTIPATERASIWADMDPIVYERAAVRALLERYRNAYERLDARAAKRVWPGVNQRALERAFADLESQTLAFEDCRVDVTTGRGTAHCRGRATYVGRVGNRDPQTHVRDWTFQLSKAGDNWAIDSIRAQ